MGRAVVALVTEDATAVGGMTMGADPIAVATAIAADQPLRSFSIRKEAKDYGMGGRLVGPVEREDRVVVLEDTTTTGGALIEAIEVLADEGITILGAISLFDRSGGKVARRLEDAGIDYQSVVTPIDLGVA